MPVQTVGNADVGNSFLAGIAIYIKSIRVIGTGATVAGDDFQINDNLATPVDFWRTVAGGAWYVEESITQRHWPNGFKVVACDSGQIDIEYETGRYTLF